MKECEIFIQSYRQSYRIFVVIAYEILYQFFVLRFTF